jgi:hypothetical protein
MIVYREHPDHALATHNNPSRRFYSLRGRHTPLERTGSMGSLSRLSDGQGEVRKEAGNVGLLVYLETLQGMRLASTRRIPGLRSETWAPHYFRDDMKLATSELIPPSGHAKVPPDWSGFLAQATGLAAVT